MADHPIIKINVDDDEFNAFLEKYHEYQEDLAKSGSAWEGTNSEIKKMNTGFESALMEYTQLSAEIVNPKLGQAISGFQRLSIASAKAWHSMSQDIEKSGKGMSLLARLGVGLGAAAVAAIGVVGAGVALVGMTAGAAKELSDENRFNRENNLAPGERTAFDDQYGTTLGASDSDISHIADIKNDQSRWSELITATNGKVGFDDIQRLDPVDLYLKSLKAAGETYSAMGPQGGQWAESQGANALFGAGTVRNAATRDNQWWEQQHGQYTAERDKIATSPSALDQSTAFEQKWKADMTEVSRNFENALVPLEPIFIKITTKITDFFTAFEKSPQFADDIKHVGDAFEYLYKHITDFEDWMGKVGKILHPINTAIENDIYAPVEKVGKGFWQSIKDIYKVTTGEDLDAPKAADEGGKATPATGKGSGATGDESAFVRDPDRLTNMSALEAQYKMPPHLMSAVEQQESSGGTKNHNPKNPAVLGAFQFDQPTAEKYGVNRFDERSSENGAARLLNDLHTRYGDWGKAVAAYDGFAGLDADIAKYGDKWRDHISEFQKGTETTDYLTNVEKRGVDFDDDKHAVKQDVAALPSTRGTADDAATTSGPDGYPSRKPATAPNMAPILFNFKVQSPPGWDVHTSMGAIVQ